jgi:hypothetical protein
MSTTLPVPGLVDGGKRSALSSQQTELLLTPAEAAAILRVEVTTLADWRCKRVGPAFVKIGRSVLYSREAIERYIDDRTIETDSRHNRASSPGREVALARKSLRRRTQRANRMGRPSRRRTPGPILSAATAWSSPERRMRSRSRLSKRGYRQISRSSDSWSGTGASIRAEETVNGPSA